MKQDESPTPTSIKTAEEKIGDIIQRIKRHPAIVSEQQYNKWYIEIMDVMQEYKNQCVDAAWKGFLEAEGRAERLNKTLKFDDESPSPDSNEAEVNKLVECLKELSDAEPYPEDIFLPVSKELLQDIHKLLLKTYSIPLDRLTGQIGRVLYSGIKSKAKEALNE